MQSVRRELIRERHTRWLLMVAAANLVVAVALVPVDIGLSAAVVALVPVWIYLAFRSLGRALPMRLWFRQARTIAIGVTVVFGAFSLATRGSNPSASNFSGLIALITFIALLKGAFSEPKRYRGIELAGEAMRRAEAEEATRQAEAGEVKSDGSSAGG